MSEAETVAALFEELMQSPLQIFPVQRAPLAAPDEHGVYVIVDPSGAVVHVGRTVRGRAGLSQRLYDHTAGTSSFSYEFLKGKGATLRGAYKFRYVRVSDARLRALLEAYAIGHLCPAHLGLGEVRATSVSDSSTTSN